MTTENLGESLNVDRGQLLCSGLSRNFVVLDLLIQIKVHSTHT